MVLMYINLELGEALFDTTPTCPWRSMMCCFPFVKQLARSQGKSNCRFLYHARLTTILENEISKDANTFAPAFESRIEINLVREGIGLAGGNGGYMFLLFIDDGHDFHGSFLQRRSHGLDDFCALCDILSNRAGATMWTA